jgi:hypothetical protein
MPLEKQLLNLCKNISHFKPSYRSHKKFRAFLFLKVTRKTNWRSEKKINVAGGKIFFYCGSDMEHWPVSFLLLPL